ncbi:hypothetical protein BD410DRAFT_894091 [Rickenella mellea]|uniref:DUF7582 domain-containing protein n=1 Tax=Rickenella mellea TaxID=50990 RepID=A0A4Y7QKS0_9AGAM|nr:hypothetical protein BD410DRAFT_894091 [Rickenella mellea]
MGKTLFTADDIVKGLRHVSEFIKKNNSKRLTLPINLIVAGGAVSVLVLHNRPATHDVDYWASDDDEMLLVEKAGEMTAAQLDYDEAWLNADMSTFIDCDPAHCDFEKNSIEQNILVFKSDSLRVYVADWKYQLTQKLMRMTSTQNPEPKELSDAVAILQMIVQGMDEKALSKESIRAWYPYGYMIKDDTLSAVQEAYMSKFPMAGLV